MIGVSCPLVWLAQCQVGFAPQRFTEFAVIDDGRMDSCSTLAKRESTAPIEC